MGRLINDSLYPNASMRGFPTFGYPHLCLFAIQDIKEGEEILYRYGPDFPWHDQVRLIVKCIYTYKVIVALGI
jgi:Proteins containing SET domain